MHEAHAFHPGPNTKRPEASGGILEPMKTREAAIELAERKQKIFTLRPGRTGSARLFRVRDQKHASVGSEPERICHVMLTFPRQRPWTHVVGSRLKDHVPQILVSVPRHVCRLQVAEHMFWYAGAAGFKVHFRGIS